MDFDLRSLTRPPAARRVPMMALANGGLHATVRCDELSVFGPPGGAQPQCPRVIMTRKRPGPRRAHACS